MSFFGKLFGKSQPKDEKQITKEPEVEVNKPKHKNGFIEIKGNTIYVTDPIGDGLAPKLYVPVNFDFEIFCDGELIVGEIEVTSQSVFETNISDFPLENAGYDIHQIVSPDRMKVTLKKELYSGKRYELEDKVPANHVEISVIEKEYTQGIIESEIIEQLIESEGYQGRIDQEAINEFCQSTENVEKDIIFGIEPVEGTPAYYEKIVEIKRTIDLVKQDEHIGNFVKEIPGVSGIDVMGDEIPTQLVYQLPKIGEGIIDRDGQLFSAREGRLVFDEKDIMVLKQVILNRDLVEADGVIDFSDGDIIVKGNIMEGCTLHAGGIVTVTGGVYGAKVYGEQGVDVAGNISNAEVYCGWTLFTYKKIDIIVSRLLNQINRFSEDYDDALTKPSFVLRGLYKKLNENIEHILKNNTEDIMKKDGMYQNIVEELESKWLKYKVKREDIDTFIQLLERYILSIAPLLELRPAHLTAGNLTSSSLYCSGDIDIKVSGAYLSQIESGGKIKIKGSTKGGIIIAEHAIELEEYLSTATNVVGVKVRSSQGYIKIAKRHPDTLIKVGDQQDLNFETKMNVHYKIDPKKA